MDKVRLINGKYYDFGTSNRSFLQCARDIHVASPHVNNYLFMLEIKDPSLSGIDPYKVEPKDKITIGKIQIECIQNIWYFLREICRIPIQGGTTIPFIAHRANIAQIFLFLHGIDSITYIARQLGKTTSALCTILWCVLYGTTNSTVTMFHYKYEMCVNNLTLLKDYIKELPFYLKPPTMIRDSNGNIRKLKDNTKEYFNPLNYNRIRVIASANNYQTALLAGRGLTTPIVLIDEFDYIKYIKTILNTSTPAFRTASENARLNNAPYGRILVSTPGDLTTQEGLESYTLVTQMPIWSESLYNLSKEDIQAYVKKNGSQPFIRIEYQYNQLSKTNEWFNEVTFGLDSVTVRRDYLLQRVTSSQNSPFDQDDLDYLASNVAKPIHEIAINECLFQFYAHLDYHTNQIFDPNIPYIIGVDCSSGVGNDFQAITIFNPYNLKIAGEFKSQWLGEFDLSQLLHDLIAKYIKKGVLCIERNSVGSAIIENLFHTNIAHRIYVDASRDIIESGIRNDMNKESILKKRAEMKRYAGVYTEYASRQRMMDILERYVHTMKDRINTRNLVEDIMKLIRKPNGKIEAGPGFHDDSCFVGDTLVMTSSGNRKISTLQEGDYVFTRSGLRRIEHIYVRQANTITKFGFTGTPTHPFITESGIVEFQNLTENTRVYVMIAGRLICTRIYNIIDTSEDYTNLPEESNIVYNLYVHDCHEYFANNILVHNCMSWLIGMYVWHHGNNLIKFGVDKTKCNIYQENEGMLMEDKHLAQDKLSNSIKQLYARPDNYVDGTQEESKNEELDFHEFYAQYKRQSQIEDEALIRSGLVKKPKEYNENNTQQGVRSVQNVIRTLYNDSV